MENGHPHSYLSYFKKAFFWVLGNVAFGLAPLLFMWFVFMTSQGYIGSDEMSHLIHDGVVLFVCCAVMGAVFVEFVLSGYLMKGSDTFAIYSFPLFLIALISLDYLFIHLKIIDGSCFELNSKTSIFVLIFSFVYSTFSKADLYIREDSTHDIL